MNERMIFFNARAWACIADSSVRKIIDRLRKGDLKETSSRQRSSDKRYQLSTYQRMLAEAVKGMDGTSVEKYSASLEKYMGFLCQQKHMLLS